VKELLDNKGMGEQILKFAVNSSTFCGKQHEDETSEIVNGGKAFFDHGVSL
jgi:hypothetical protein